MKRHLLPALLWLAVPVVAMGIYPVVKGNPQYLKYLATGLALYVLFFSIVIHEVCHGLGALLCGDTTAADAKRLTLNPVSHVDIFGSVILPIVLAVSGSSMLFGWARPVPFNPTRLRRHPRDQAALAMAGPLANFALSLVCFQLYLAAGLIYKFTSGSVPPMFLMTDPYAPIEVAAGPLQPLWAVVFQTLIAGILTNAVLGVFNLVPVPPLDGGWILKALLPPRISGFLTRMQLVAFILLIVAMKFNLLVVFFYPAFIILGLFQGLAGACLG